MKKNRTKSKWAVLPAAVACLFAALFLTGCADTAKKAGKAAVSTTVEGAKQGAKTTAKGVRKAGSAAAGAVTKSKPETTE